MAMVGGSRHGWSKRARVVSVLLVLVTQTSLAAVTRADLGGATDTLRDPVLAAAGDIACPSTDPGFHATLGAVGVCQMRATSDQLLALHPTAVATLGDNQYDDASLAQFQASF